MTRPYVLGLTGSVGMGKTTTARLFAEEGCAVWDADGAVHRLYGPGGAAVAGIAAIHPPSVVQGAVSRQQLKDWIATDDTALRRIEAVVHPLVAADRARFLRESDAEVAVLDIPLLYEIGADAECDSVAVVSAPAEVQRARVMDRPGMTEAQFEMLLAKQLPDAEKRRRADHLIETTTLDAARAAVRAILTQIRGNHA